MSEFSHFAIALAQQKVAFSICSSDHVTQTRQMSPFQFCERRLDRIVGKCDTVWVSFKIHVSSPFFFCDFKLRAKQMNTNIASVETRWTWSRVQWQLKWTKQDFQRLNPQLWILYHFLRVKEVKICLLRWTRRQNKPVQTLFGHSRHQVWWLLLCCTSE